MKGKEGFSVVLNERVVLISFVFIALASGIYFVPDSISVKNPPRTEITGVNS